MAITQVALQDATRLRLNDDTDEEFSDARVNAAIAAAVAEYSKHRPVQTSTTSSESTTAKRIALSAFTLTGYDPDEIRPEAIEYPVDQDPKSFVRFDQFGTTLTLDIPTDISAESVTLFYSGPHKLSGGSYATLPAAAIEPLADGAAGYALKQAAAEAAASLTVQPRQAERQLAIANDHLAVFRNWLATRTVRQGSLFRPAEANPLSRFTDLGPQ